ncbi:phosphoglycerate kinase [Candidatus Woesearchaeota archaeon]|nr:phosphoglycerate kinase [Candidatus Woesearchaeota archaeon]
MPAMPTLKNAYIGEKKVIVRTGFDVPVDDTGKITDDSRIRASIPTIRYLLDHGAKQIIIITHIGRPKNHEQILSTGNAAKRVSELIEEKVIKIDDYGQAGLPSPDDARIIMLENLRFDSREKDKDIEKRDSFGKELASLANIYVNDSFSTCHRDHASMTSVPKFLPSCAGISVEQEVETISKTITDPKHPFVSVIGGLKADKLNAVINLLDRVDKVLIGGALAFTLLKEFGKNVGDTKIDSEGLDGFKDLIDKIKDNPKVLLPVDCIVANKFANDADAKVCSVNEIKPGWMALDIGPDTINIFRKELSQAKTIIWNGPIGVFEFYKFAEGTKQIATAIANSDAVSVVGGGDSGAAVEKMGLKDSMTLVSSGGGASLRLFEGKDLIALKALYKN